MAIEFQVKLKDEIRSDILRTVVSSAQLRGQPLPNITEGSDEYRLADAVANQLEALYAAIASLPSAFLPSEATGEDLDKWLENFDLSRRPPGPSVGNVLFNTTALAPTLIARDTELLAPDGSKFLVTTTGSYSNNDLIQVQSSEVGLNTNVAGGVVLRWVSPPAFSDPTAAFDTSGASGGTDLEDDETARARLLERIQANGPAGNEEAQIGWAESASVRIQKAFVYPAANGPSTSHIAVAGYAISSALRSRQVDAATVLAAKAAVLANAPLGIEFVVTGCTDVPASVSFLLQIPQSVAAIPFGTGGGWVDANPFPNVLGLTQKFCNVSAVTNTTRFIISNCSNAPAVGQSICYVDKTNFKLYTAKVILSTPLPLPPLPGPYVVDVTIDTPFLNIQVGDYIFPAAERMQAYVDAVLNAFADLGPGEKTDQTGLLPRAFRAPRSFESWDCALGPKFLKALVESGDEVYDAAWGYQNGGVTLPALPTLISQPPNLFVPYRIAFYPAA